MYTPPEKMHFLAIISYLSFRSRDCLQQGSLAARLRLEKTYALWFCKKYPINCFQQCQLELCQNPREEKLQYEGTKFVLFQKQS